MDTISRENNSMLPLGGLIVGVVALIISAIAVFSLPNIKNKLAAHEEKLSHLDDIAAQATSANSKADTVNSRVDALTKSTQDAVTAIGNAIGEVKSEIAKIEESQKRPAHGAKGAKGAAGEAVVAGPGEYIVKHGDTGRKIAHANGVSLADLTAVNPDVNWSHLKVDQKIKLPEKK